MEFLVIWLITIVVSMGMDVANELRMFKDTADAGYKINVKRLSELTKQLYPNATKVTFLSMLTPILNIVQILQETIQYNNVRPMMLDQLRVSDVLEEMSEIEKTEYLKNPTGLNAVIVSLKSEIRLSNATLLKIDEGTRHGEIYYKMGESLDDITILKVSGSASRLTVEEQKKKVIEVWKTVVQAGMEKYGDSEKFIETLNNDKIIDLGDSNDDKRGEETTLQPPQGSSIRDQSQMLESTQDCLLEEQEETQLTQMKKGPRLLRKRK